ncbi:PF07598 family protein [Leptospira noguchii]|uniref:PF07598 family protein n=1 Tax=Leptospira noguchii TaxID=28182 RepID=M6VU99_9LEPT|nr:PF07598 family protein [Leptospira noguchii]
MVISLENSSDYYNHTLDSSMNDWVNTIATPGNISILTSISWEMRNSSGIKELYFVRWGASEKNTTPLYYNPESGHIAQYDPVSGSLYCMYSKMTDNYDWNWVKWALCSDAAISKDNPAFWNVFFETDKGGMITDYKGNALRVTRYGSNWGVVYTVKPSYLEKDTTHSPTSLFVVDKDLLDWTRYTASNLGKTDQYCPAGNKESLAHKRVKRTLPSDFQLTEAWIRRLYNITSTNSNSRTASGICGVCMLQTLQMIAELQEYHSQGPLQSGGYFFDTAPNTDPFVSFRLRYPHLDRLLVDILNVFNRYFDTSETLGYLSAMNLLPQYEWGRTREFTTMSEIRSHIRALIASPPGSIYLVLMTMVHSDGTTSGHAVPILRTSQGLVVIQTNMATTTFEIYRSNLRPTTNPEQVIRNLRFQNSVLTGVSTLELGRRYHNPLDSMISNRNCTGEGGDRRGSGGYPTSASVNQCPSSRCVLQ